MARARRNAHKHVASERPDRSPNPEVTPRHKAARRHVTRVAGSAVLALSVAGTVAALEADHHRVDLPTSAPAALSPVDLSVRTAQVSRSISRAVSRTAARPLPTARRVVLQPTAVDHAFTTTPLNLRTGPSPDSARVRTVPFATRLAVTGQTSHGWAEVLVRREVPAAGHGAKHTPRRTVTVVRWVNADYLAQQKPSPPKPEPEPTPSASSPPASSSTSSSSDSSSSSSSSTAATSGVSGAPCPDGSSTESGLTSSAVRLFRAVCAAFPALSSYGGYDPHGEHADGRAIDFMITDASLGQAVANYVQANAGTLGVYDIIWAQHIWTPERSSEGWRFMPDRGSATANHYDHVHVAVY
jgi:hypothetical protein